MDSDISLAVSTRMPYCPFLTFEDDSFYKHAKDKSETVSIAHAVEVPWITCTGFYPYTIS